MTVDNLVHQTVSTMNAFLPLAGTKIKRTFTLTAILFFGFTCFAQQQATTTPSPDPSPAGGKTTLTVPAGTKLSLVLTHSVLSRSTHRGDDVYAQTVFPVSLGNEVVIPPGHSFKVRLTSSRVTAAAANCICNPCW